jgi:hypothetical protein
LVTFLIGIAAMTAGTAQQSLPLASVGGGVLLLFVVLVVLHARLLERREQALALAEVHARHRSRIEGRWMTFPARGDLLPSDHGYARDLDLVGPGSLMQRIDVTRTTRGERLLASWLAAPADAPTVSRRQEAVRELAGQVDLRCALEAAGDRPVAARGGARSDKLDPDGFVALGKVPSVFAERPWLTPLVHAFPIFSTAVIALWSAGFLPGAACLVPPAISLALQFVTGRRAHGTFDLIAARRGIGEAFATMLGALERARWQAPALQELQRHAQVEGKTPSAHLRVLERWAGLSELRTQFPLHLPANLFLLWDLQCLLRIERWARRVGAYTDAWFDALAEVEALSSLATLAHQDPSAVFPELSDPGGPLEVEDLVHPLLPPAERVGNDVRLDGPGSALIVTGSNMAGKSTLLRAVGLAACLAYAGGPVTARRMRLPLLRIRASMRAEDSLLRGASYFHAELERLRRVVDDANGRPPLLFLLDELLRGTNAYARNVGARAIVVHLLRRGAMGLVATHDVALATLETEFEGRVRNVHFTDVLEDGQLRFDYRLRPGVVRSSNALRLLALAGIDVPAEALAAEDAARVPEPAPPSTSAASAARS